MASTHFFDCHVCSKGHYFLPADEACYLCNSSPTHILCRFCHEQFPTEQYQYHLMTEKEQWINFCYVSKTIIFTNFYFIGKPNPEMSRLLEEERQREVLPKIEALLEANRFKSMAFHGLKYGQFHCFKLESTASPHKTFTLRLMIDTDFIGVLVNEEVSMFEDLMKPFKTAQEMVECLNLNIDSKQLHHLGNTYIQGKTVPPVTAEMYPSCISIPSEGETYNIYFEYSNRSTKSLYRFMKQYGYEHYYEIFQSMYICSLDSLYWARKRTYLPYEVYQYLRGEMMKKSGLYDKWTTFNPLNLLMNVEVPNKWKGLRVTMASPSESIETGLLCSCSGTLKVVKIVDVEARKIYYNKAENMKGIRAHEVSHVTDLQLGVCSKCFSLRKTDLNEIAIAINSTAAAIPIGLHVTSHTVEELYRRATQDKSLQLILPETGSAFLKPDTYKRMITDQRFGPATHKPPFKTQSSKQTVTTISEETA